ncbi:MAG: hypothetical protein ACUVX8_10280 [Candidatus Zipacnadales bacterium]
MTSFPTGANDDANTAAASYCGDSYNNIPRTVEFWRDTLVFMAAA